MKKRVLSLFLAFVLCLTLLPTSVFAEGEDVSISGGVIGGSETGGEGGGIYVAPGSPTEGGGGKYIPGEDTRTEIWCVSKPDSIGRSYDGTTNGDTISLGTLGFTDGENSYTLTEGTDFTAKRTFDSADAGDRTVTVEIALIGDAATKYKLKAGKETFTIGGIIYKAHPNLTVSLSKPACTAGEKLLPLLSVSGAPEGAAVTYYYAPLNSGYLEFEGTEIVPEINENTAISEPGTYYVYAKTGETTNYKEERSTTVELTVNEPAAASVTKADGTDGGTYTTLPAALDAAQDGDTVTLLSDVDLGETDVTIDKSITFDLGDKTLSSSKAWLSYGVLMVKNATVTVKNGTVKAAEMGSCAIRAYGSGASMTLENVTATVTSDKSSVTVGDFGSAVIKSGDYQGLYVGAKSQVTLEGGTFRPYMDTTTNKNVKSIFWKVNETTDATSRDCMELLGDGCVYVDENRTQVRTGGGFNAVVTVQKDTAIDAPVAKIGDVEYASLSKAINAVQNGGTITLLDDLDLGSGAVLQVGSSQKNFTIDLDNHTLSADGACLIMLHNGSQLTLKNGTLDGSRCTSYGGVLYISSKSGPKLTLENVTAKSGTVTGTLNGQRPVLLAYVISGTVEFNGGTYTGGVLLKKDKDRNAVGSAVLKSGTFQKGTNDYSIKTEDSGKHLSDYLDDDSQFWDDNTPLDLSNETQTADKVTVRPCEHKWENGKCTVCQKVCDHGSADGKSMTEDSCPTCGMKAAAQVDITGSDAKYFPSFTDALVYATKNNGCTLKLLADVPLPEGTTLAIVKPLILDLNGHSIDRLSVSATVKIRDSGTTRGKIGALTVSNMMDAAGHVTDLTLGDLLEEGYAFKYENGHWADDSHKETISGLDVTVEKAPIQSVEVYAKDKKNKEVPTNMAYGTTGEVTLVSSCRMGETSGADPTYLWYKLEGAAATAPLEGATGANYTLPDNLAAGTHTYLLICTSDGYSESKEITITVTPISLEGAEVTVENPTYNGQKQFPAVTVKLDENTTLTKGTDFYVDATMQANAGSYMLTVNGNGNYSGKIENVEWKIDPLPISLLSVSSISKTYDGSADVTLTADKLTFFSKTASRQDITLPNTALTFSDAQFTSKQEDGSYLPSPEVGGGKALSFTMTLTSNNYVFEGKSEGTTEVSDVFATDDVNRFTITKAAAPTDIQTGTLNVVNGTKLEYTYDAKQLLPKAPKGTYGKVSYNCEFPFNLKNGYYVDDIAIKDSILTLTIDALNGGETGKIGTIPVYVTTDNYASFNLPLDLYAVNKITPVADGEITAAGITYGDALSKSTISGKMKDPNTGATVNGTFAWTDGTTKPAANDSYEAEWTFTPAAGYEKYATATGTVTIKVNKATPTFTAPTAQENLTYTGQEQALIIAGSVTSGGTMQYSLTENGTYSQDIPVGTDAGTYTVWYRVIGDENHNDTAPASVAVRIGKKPLTITGVTAASKPYDGTKKADISSVTFDGVNWKQGTDYTVTASFDDASVGNGKNITATVTLMGQTAKNYALEQSSFPTTGSITKAAAPDFTKETALTIVNGHEKTYTVTLPALPTLETPKEYGALTYEIGEIKLNDGYYTSGAKVENGKLILPIQKNDVKTTGSVGTVTVAIKSTNYADITLTVNVNATNKLVPTVTAPTANALTYNGAEQALVTAGKTTGGTMRYRLDDSEWSEQIPTAKNAGKYTVWYKVQGDAEYADVAEQSLTVTVAKKAVTVTALDKSAYTGSTAPDLSSPEADKNYKVEGLLGADTLSGTVTLTYAQTPDMSKTGKTAINIAGTLSNGNYEITYVPGTLTVSDRPSSGGGGSSSDRDTSGGGTVKTETTKNNDGSVTKTETKKDGTKVETTTGKDGSTTKTETKKDGSSVTESKDAAGSTGTVKTDKNGQTTAETTLSSKAIETAKRNGEPVKAPVEVKATRDSDTAHTVKVELPKGAGETKVEIPVTNVKHGTVAVLVHADGTEEIVKNSLPTEDGIQLTVNGGATVKIVDNSKDFADTRNHWAKDAIDFVSARGMVNGMSATIYAPNASTTRAQLWTILARQNNADLTGGATWFENAQNWAKAKGISDGANPNAAINRAQMVTMLWRAVGQPVAGSTANFADVSADAYYASAVAWAVENGITTGVGNGKFDPNATCTRGQIATFLWRAMAE